MKNSSLRKGRGQNGSVVTFNFFYDNKLDGSFVGSRCGDEVYIDFDREKRVGDSLRSLFDYYRKRGVKKLYIGSDLFNLLNQSVTYFDNIGDKIDSVRDESKIDFMNYVNYDYTTLDIDSKKRLYNLIECMDEGEAKPILKLINRNDGVKSFIVFNDKSGVVTKKLLRQGYTVKYVNRVDVVSKKFNLYSFLLHNYNVSKRKNSFFDCAVLLDYDESDLEKFDNEFLIVKKEGGDFSDVVDSVNGFSLVKNR